MKKDAHPKYQQVLFVDSASGHKFVCGSTIQADATEKFQGKEYPVVYLSISSSSHPFFTGSKQLVDSEGRVEKFKKRFERAAAPQQQNEEDKQDSEDKSAAKGKKKETKKAAAK